MFKTKNLVYEAFPEQVKTAPALFVKLFISFLQKLFHEKTFAQIAKNNTHLKGLDYADNLLDGLNITYTVKPNELKNIPATGRLIVIANHITGMQDSFSLVQLIAYRRENKTAKMLINQAMYTVSSDFGLGIPVNVNGGITKTSLKAIYKSLDNDEAIIIFPAGFVNRFSLKGLRDSAWKASFLKIAQKKSAPILPIKITGRNSILFYALSAILPNKISSFMLFREFATAGKRKPLHFTIGQVVPAESFANKEIRPNEYVEMFYTHLYTLKKNKGDILKTEITIGSPKNKRILKEEVKAATFLGNTKDGKKIILADAANSPFLIRELGRIREISFRAIGGGTGTSHDNDKYDTYYRHLILWDREALEIVGAYRIGECQSIIQEKGKEGLYTHKLCEFKENFGEFHNNAVELGRSFIQPQYWGSRALDNLWQGLGAYLAYNPDIQYAYGMVTINAETPPKATAALVYFYSSYFACSKNIMAARTPYCLSDEDQRGFDALFKDIPYKEALVLLKSYLKEQGSIIPTLFKQYTELYHREGVSFLDFNVNTAWSNVVEGFIIAEISSMKAKKRKRYIEGYEKLHSIDTVTQLPNHANFCDVFTTITRYRRKPDLNFNLTIIQISSFEQISTDLGDTVWDDFMTALAKKIKQTLRTNDIIAKWENSEFIVLLKNVVPEEMNNISKKLKTAIETVRANSDLEAICSIGTSTYRDQESIEDTVQRAYQKLTV